MKRDRYAYVCTEHADCPIVPSELDHGKTPCPPAETSGWTVGLIVEGTA